MRLLNSLGPVWDILFLVVGQGESLVSVIPPVPVFQNSNVTGAIGEITERSESFA